MCVLVPFFSCVSSQPVDVTVDGTPSNGGTGGCVPDPYTACFAKIIVVGPGDPNDKASPVGAGAQHYISGASLLPYTVFFANEPTASAPAQVVTVTDQLDATKVDLSSFALGPITLGTTVVTPPARVKSFATNVDLRPSKNLILRINEELSGSMFTAQFTSIDPATNAVPTDPLNGFLPPDSIPPAGEGSVTFWVTPLAALATGAQITNQAKIVFDANSPINTPTRLNTIDKTPPVSRVRPLSPIQSTPNFQVQWSGTDVGSGIATYTIFGSDDGGKYVAWLTDTSQTFAIFSGQTGHTYGFYGVARDQAGNIEVSPASAQATTKVQADTTPPTTTATSSPVANAVGWNMDNVTVTLTAADEPGGSGLAATYFSVDNNACTPSSLAACLKYSAPFVVSTEGTHKVVFFSQDVAGNLPQLSSCSPTASACQNQVTIRIDKTPPTLTFDTPSPAPDINGWNNTDVTVPCTFADGLSGVAVVSPACPLVLTTQGASVTGTVTVTDVAGNTATFTSPPVKIDKTPPQTTAAASPAPNVTVTLTSSDSLSGADHTEYNLDGAGWTVYAEPVAITTEGVHALQYRSVDKAGNVETAQQLTVNIDKRLRSPFQPPLTTLTNTVDCSSDCHSITNTIKFTITEGGFVTIQDDLLHGPDLVAGTATFDGTSVPTCGSPALAPCDTLVGSSPDRKTYDFNLGFVTAGSHTLSFTSHVGTPFPKGNLYTKDSVNLYEGASATSQTWKGKASANAPAP